MRNRVWQKISVLDFSSAAITHMLHDEFDVCIKLQSAQLSPKLKALQPMLRKWNSGKIYLDLSISELRRTVGDDEMTLQFLFNNVLEGRLHIAVNTITKGCYLGIGLSRLQKAKQNKFQEAA